MGKAQPIIYVSKYPGNGGILPIPAFREQAQAQPGAIHSISD